MSDYSDYVAAAMVACPQCGEKAGDPCRERQCKSGHADCKYVACSVWVEQSVPHLARAVKARQVNA